ncbi:hypothetical protein [Aeromicrobium sp. PE09-221]|uniref:hypothetical protein n=1 Tax=Aeromicrobium sp. PE09-221 TaxID=1898043 RepID=UPI0014833F93|nr:hypothetical protein [Aeromicrobium sp. PE09-221]
MSEQGGGPEEMVGEVLRRLDDLDEVEIDEHPARFDAVHDDLRRVLRGEPVAPPS